MERELTRITRRRLVILAGGLGAIAASAACAAPMSSPTAPPPPLAAPTTAPPTLAPAKPATAPTQPRAQPTAVKAPAKLPSLTKLKIANSSPLLESAWRFMALEKGFWRDLGLDVEITHVTSGTTMIQALVSGEFDGANLGSSPIYPAVAQGAPIRMTASFMPKIFYLFYVRPEINSWEDLKGKRLGGSAPGALIHEVTRAVLFEKNIDFESTEYVNVGGSPDVFRAIVAGKVDAGPSGVEFLREAQESGQAKSLATLFEVLPNYLRNADIASEKTLKDKADAYLIYLYGQTLGHRYAQTHKQETLELATKITQRDATEEGWVFDWYVDNKIVDMNGLVDPKKVEYMIDLSNKIGSMNTRIPASQVIDDSLQQKVIAMLGKQ